MDFNNLTNMIKDFSNQEARCKKLFFSNALAGEVGEYCNLVKKIHRDKRFNSDILTNIENELADIFIYLVLNAKQYFIDLELAILNKLMILEKR